MRYNNNNNYHHHHHHRYYDYYYDYDYDCCYCYCYCYCYFFLLQGTPRGVLDPQRCLLRLSYGGFAGVSTTDSQKAEGVQHTHC